MIKLIKGAAVLAISLHIGITAFEFAVPKAEGPVFLDNSMQYLPSVNTICDTIYNYEVFDPFTVCMSNTPACLDIYSEFSSALVALEPGMQPLVVMLLPAFQNLRENCNLKFYKKTLDTASVLRFNVQ